MTRVRSASIFGALVIASGALWLVLTVPEKPLASSSPRKSKVGGGKTARGPSAEASPVDQMVPTGKELVPVSASQIAVPAPEPQAEAVAETEKVSLMLRDYRSVVRENPVGSNAEIMKAVMGGNPKQARLGPPEGQSINGDGELVDRWGTPYFFHQLSGNSMEVRSAGPDKTLWTKDDVVQR